MTRTPVPATLILSDKSSGSTVLIEALTAGGAAHRVSFTQHQEHETLFWWKAATMLGFSQPALRSTRLPIAPIHARAELEELLDRNDVDLGRPLDSTAPEELVFEGWAAICRRYSPCFVEKSPHHLHHWQALQLMRSAPGRVDGLRHRYVGLVRHPVATLASMWRRWGVDPQRAQWEWVRAYRNLVRLREALGDELLLVRYEDLVTDQQVWASVWAHAGLEGEAPTGWFDERRATAWRERSDLEFRPADPIVELAGELGYPDVERGRWRPSAARTFGRARSATTRTARRWRRKVRAWRSPVHHAEAGAVLPPRRRLLCVSPTAQPTAAPVTLIELLARGVAAQFETTILFGERGPMRREAIRLGLAVEDIDRRADLVARARRFRHIMKRCRPDVLFADGVVAFTRDAAVLARAQGVPVLWVQRPETQCSAIRMHPWWVRRLASIVVGVSEDDVTSYSEGPRVEVIPEGVDAGRAERYLDLLTELTRGASGRGGG